MMSSFTKMFSRILNNRVFLLTLCNFSYRQCALKSALVTMLISLSPVSRLASRSCQIRWIRGWERLSTNTTIFPQLMFRSGMIKEFFVHIAIMFHKKRKEEISSITFIFHQKSFETFSHFHLNILRFFFQIVMIFYDFCWEVKVWMDNIFNIMFHSKKIHFSRI